MEKLKGKIKKTDEEVILTQFANDSNGYHRFLFNLENMPDAVTVVKDRKGNLKMLPYKELDDVYLYRWRG